MATLLRILDFYIKASIHVGFAVYALVRMTHHMFGIQGHDAMPMFAFFSTIAGYNFVKYHTIAFSKPDHPQELRGIIAISAISGVGAAYFYLQLGTGAQVATAIFAALTILYALPFFPNRRNARNWAGVKIYIVALCWAGVTVALPILDAGIALTADFYLKCIQRFLLVFVLILIFEIVDMNNDDPLLKTVPQQIGQNPTKILGLSLLAIFFALELLRTGAHENQMAANSVLVLVTAGMLTFANTNRSRYYAGFWAESIPILWWLLILSD